MEVRSRVKVTVEVAVHVAPLTKFPMDAISSSTGRLFSLTIPGGSSPVEVNTELAVDVVVVGAAVVVGAVMKE